MSSGDRTRERIEQVALELFLENGYAGTPLRLIAEAAEVTTPALYWHYRSKDDLCFSIVAREYQEFADTLRATVKPGPPEDRLREYVEAFVSIQLRRRTRTMKLGLDQLAAALPDAQRAEIATIQRPLYEQLREILRDGEAASVFDVLDATVTALAIISMANYVFTWITPMDPLAIDEIARAYGDLALRLASDGSAQPGP